LLLNAALLVPDVVGNGLPFLSTISVLNPVPFKVI
ncbi:hypothetical protein AAUPMG_01763, partial [Pasteurella multocida subsp. multocida str. Anand1_goat]